MSTSATARPVQAGDLWEVYATMFEDHLEAANAAPNTIRTYMIAAQQLGVFLGEKGMPHDPTRVTREHLVEWMRHLQRPRGKGGQGLTAQTALQRYRSVSRFFAFLVQTDEIKASPMAKMTPPLVPEKQVPIIRDADLRKLLKEVDGADFESRRDRAIISLFIDCGMRVAEMAGITLADVDLGERDVTITGKGRRSRTLRYIRETRSDLQRYLLRRARHPHADSRWLWVGKRGLLTAGGVYRMVVRRCEDAGIPPSIRTCSATRSPMRIFALAAPRAT